MKNIISSLIFLLLICAFMIWRWETASEELKDILFYTLCCLTIGQNVYSELRKKRSS